MKHRQLFVVCVDEPRHSSSGGSSGSDGGITDIQNNSETLRQVGHVFESVIVFNRNRNKDKPRPHEQSAVDDAGRPAQHGDGTLTRRVPISLMLESKRGEGKGQW